MDLTAENRRILIIDDNTAIHDDFRKILVRSLTDSGFGELESQMFNRLPERPATSGPTFEITCAAQGEEGRDLVRKAKESGLPFAVTFVDGRMPPGWDGLRTASEIWKVDPNIEVVLCTAYSDHTWEETVDRLGKGARFLILKKPFDSIEVKQLAQALTEKWKLSLQARARMDELEQMVTERTGELREINSRLEHEMSERERMQAVLVRSQKLEALGQLIAGIAHEINNPLSFVLANLRFLDQGLQESREALVESLVEMRQVVHETMGGANRIQRIVRDLKLFATEVPDANELVDINAVLEASLTLVKGDLARVGTLVTGFQSQSRATCNSGRLGQVLLNLLVNGIQALDPARMSTNQLRVTTRDLELEVAIEIEDTGCGIAPENLGKIFNPFFTTKPVGQGTGLGLAICHGIIESAKGRMTVESEPGKGAKFTLFLARETTTGALAQTG